jgi:membrane-bound metal-dependent hydrolase YbcI (DUF457 family)
MPVKWKIFLALNLVLSLPALICFILMIINFLNSHRYRQDDFIFFIFTLALLIIALNGFLNIYLLQRFYPDKLLPRSLKRLNAVSLALNILAAIGMLILCIYGASLEFSRDYSYKGNDSRGKIALAVIFSLWLVQVMVLVMQGQLPVLISRNNREKMSSLIDSIGQ